MTDFTKISSSVASPFFIVGFSRSGTTLLAALLNNHSRISVTPETRFCRGVFPCGQIDQRPRDHDFLIQRVFGYWRIRDLQVDRSEYENIFRRRTANYRNAFLSLLECYRKSSGKPLVGEKSPIHIFYVATILEWFPESRVYCLVRDGRDVVTSMLKAPFTHNHLPRHAAEWAELSKMTRALQSRFPENFQVIRFEDLVAEPEKTLTMICQQLHEEFEAEQLTPVSHSAVVPEWEKGWKRDAIAGVDASKVSLWKSDCSPKALFFLNEVMAGELEYWGYEVSRAHSVPRPTAAMMKLSSTLFKGRAYRFFRTLSVRIRVLLCQMRVKAY